MQRLRGLKDTWVNSCVINNCGNNLKSGKEINGPERTVYSHKPYPVRVYDKVGCRIISGSVPE